MSTDNIGGSMQQLLGKGFSRIEIVGVLCAEFLKK